MSTYSSLPNKLASAVNGIDYAYRDAGEGPARWSCSSTSAET